MYFVSYTTTRENTKTRLNAENMPKSNAIHNVKLHQKQEAVVNLQLHCARPALSQYCKIFKGLQRDENIAKYTSTHNKRERMATNKRRKAETCQKKQQRRQNGQIRKRPNHSLSQLPQTHRLHLFTAVKDTMQCTRCRNSCHRNRETTSKFYNKKTKLHETCTACINTPHAPLPPLHNLQKTPNNAQSTETVAAETVK